MVQIPMQLHVSHSGMFASKLDRSFVEAVVNDYEEIVIGAKTTRLDWCERFDPGQEEHSRIHVAVCSNLEGMD